MPPFAGAANAAKQMPAADHHDQLLTRVLLDPLFTSHAMRRIFSDSARLQSLLDFEAALARALARAGVAPKSSVHAIESRCRASLYSLDDLAREASLAGNLAIPLVKHLTALVAKKDSKAAAYVHWGATSQDVLDTGLILQLRDALAQFRSELNDLSEILARLVETYSGTVLAGRTWLQHAAPITLGLKAAGWLDAIERHRARLDQTQSQLLVLQFGGAAGTLAALGERAPGVAKALADDLQLALPSIPWHPHRDRFAELACTLGLLVGTLGKIARDVSLMAQTEIAEVAEPFVPGRGGSSTMPQKRNPFGSAVVLSAAIRVPGLVSTMLSAIVQEHERALGGWHAEWETLPEICLLADGALTRTIEILNGLEVDKEKIAANLDLTRGLILAEAVAMALAEKIGREPAHQVVEQACHRALAQRKPLLDILKADAKVAAHLSADDLTRLLDPKNYLGSAERFSKNVLSARKSRR
jgi:3-carboxy-cis,cis-muconate cycloisomerase